MPPRPTSALIKLKSDFSGGTPGAGQTGSVRCKESATGTTFQVKFPIRQATVFRKRKASSLDYENFGEFIAARLLQSIMPPGMVPSLFLLDMEDGASVGVASEYLQESGVCTLDDYLDPDKKRPPGTHIKLIRGTPPAGKEHEYHDIDKLPVEIRKQLAKAVVISALVGDHDINPGNMMVIRRDDGSLTLSRIDFGHAFGDLLRGPKTLSGGETHPNHFVDFFNRLFLSAGQTSKLWRDYPGLVPSQDIIDAMRELNDTFHSPELMARMSQAIHDVQEAFNEIIASRLNASDKHQIILSLIHSVSSAPFLKRPLFSSFASKPSDPFPLEIDPDSEHALKEVFAGVQIYTQKNHNDMSQALLLMEIQLKIDRALQEPDSTQKLHEIKEYYRAVKALLPSPKCWIKTDPNPKAPPFTGRFDDYVAYRRARIAVFNPDDYDDASLDERPAVAAAALSPLQQLQADVRKAIIEHSIDEAITDFRLRSDFLTISPSKETIVWPASTPNETAFSGTLDEYIAWQKANLVLTLHGQHYVYVENTRTSTTSESSRVYRRERDGLRYSVTPSRAGICLAQSIAIIYNPMTGRDFPSPISQTIIGVNHTRPIAIQEFIEPSKPVNFVRPFSVFIPQSYFRKQASFTQATQALSEPVKKQLAFAIYTSQLNGDENLHPDNLVCDVTPTAQIVAIRRINLSALGREQVARTDFNPLSTSQGFSTETNYIAYLTQDPIVKKELLTLWAHTDPQSVLQMTLERFAQQLTNLSDPAIQRTALKEFLQSLTAGSTARIHLSGTIDELKAQVTEALTSSILKRCHAMQRIAKCLLITDMVEKIHQTTVNDAVTFAVCKDLLNILKKGETPHDDKLRMVAEKLARFPLSPELQTILYAPKAAPTPVHSQHQFFRAAPATHAPQPGHKPPTPTN